MPKKDKPNNAEATEESQIKFKKKRHAHSVVESNINELEHYGLDRCLDKGLEDFKYYVVISIVAYNIKTHRQRNKKARTSKRQKVASKTSRLAIV